MKRRMTTWVAACALFLGAGLAQAGTVVVGNAGFESPALSDSAYTWWADAIAPWEIVAFGANTGAFNPTTGQYALGAPEGFNVGYSRGGVISQTLTEVLTAGVTYTLTVGVGRRLDDLAGAFEFDIELLAGSVVVASVDETSGDTLSLGEFRDFSTSFLAPGGHSSLGQQLTIRLTAVTGGARQVNWDNVRLTTPESVAVPLPTSAWMGLGLLGGLGLVARLRRRKATIV